MDTIWISNGDKNNRAVVQGRVFLEDPQTDRSALTVDHQQDLGRAAEIYQDLAMGVGARVENLEQLNFATPRKLPENTITPAQNGEADIPAQAATNSQPNQ